MKKAKIAIAVVVLVLAVAAGCVAGYLIINVKGPFTGTVTYAETGEPAANVSVSDGRNVVKTDDNGRYKLSGWRKARFVTVTPPAGYWTEDYYIPVVDGTPSYNFTLERSDIEAGAEHSFLQISDTEIGEGGTGEWLDYLKELADSEKPAFLIHTGDICYEEGLKRHKNDMNTQTMGVPVRYIIGNHDYVDGDYGEQLFESIYGPVWYSFDVGNVHYIVTPFQTGADYSSGYSKNDRWRWLENDLANTDPDMKVVMFNHDKPLSDDYVIEFDRKELDLKKHNLIAWVFGHYHYNYVDMNNGETVEETDDVLNISTARPDCGGIDESPSGARMIYIDENGAVTTEMHYYDDSRFTAADETHARLLAQLPGNVLFADPIYSGGKLFAATADDDWPRECGVYCVDTASGAVVWEYETENSVKNNILLQDGKIIAQDCSGNICCLNAETGEELWSFSAAWNMPLNTSAGICTDGSLVFAGGVRDIRALDISTGEQVWQTNRDRGESSAAEFMLCGSKLIVSSHWDALVALDKETGSVLWSNDDEDIRFRSSTPAVVDENTLLVADSDAIMLVDANSGKITRKTDDTGYNFATASQPLIDGGTAYIASSDKGVVAYDIETGGIIWNMQPGVSMVYTAPYTGGDAKSVESKFILSGDTLIFAASDSRIYRINKADGSIVGSVTVGSPVLSTPVWGENGVLYAASFTGAIYELTGV